MDSQPAQEKELSPLYLHSKREALWIICAWLVCLVWTVGYSALFGYGLEGTEVKLVMGIPSWVFWGVFVPWLSATVFSIWFGLVYMRDDDLTEGSE